jgi:hypothetical protein
VLVLQSVLDSNNIIWLRAFRAMRSVQNQHCALPTCDAIYIPDFDGLLLPPRFFSLMPSASWVDPVPLLPLTLRLSGQSDLYALLPTWTVRASSPWPWPDQYRRSARSSS